MLQDEEHQHQQQYGVQDLRQLVAGRSTRLQGSDPLLLFVEGSSRNINNILSPPFTSPLLLTGPPVPVPLPHHHHQSYQYYDNFYNVNSVLGGHQLQVGGGGGVLERTTSPPPPPPSHGNHGWSVNNVSEGDGDGNNGTNNRWPRHETLTLLEVRSRLDPKFKEANQKAPLWDQVSRIMGEEHGYYRSGKKCREKFENLYKYYKKTKGGKVGRQDGKHYRFFRQLEALYGDNTSTTTFPPTTQDHDDHQEPPPSIQENQQQQQSLSTNFSNTTPTSSSENNNIMDIKMSHNDDQGLSAIACSMMMNRRALAAHDEDQVAIKNNSKNEEKVKGFVEVEMRRLVEAQEVWMERVVRMIEEKEKERVCREEEWTKREAARLDMEHEVWAKERAWMEARDARFLDTFKKYTAKVTGKNSSSSCFDEDMMIMMRNNESSCVGTGSSRSRLEKLHGEGQELWSGYELMNKEKKPVVYK